jgi:Lon protease-like protein
VTNFIPIFPLALVVFPGEALNLHIFEPRYKELVNECHAGGKPFGIPAVIENKVSELGTLVEIEYTRPGGIPRAGDDTRHTGKIVQRRHRQLSGK